ncbi:pyrroline-5-carboxylate reductase [Geosporobacter subterraneus DSM 17957]|uniref:Pyrroline-5-carboxylate reductase n=1 Tax=Geosporobacter subterraneus DSM 17957 TaxID=1121919 RepID=A0A1M6EGE3_9FIRM|nr:pyrroline-5-carboxylate reductase [Geosporobacter subterraneus]SHI84521.1 pyrroline-5-carboxylate reductase [Geosporobacter subterraneus DSM 17957]
MDKKIGFIGCGNMAMAMIQGIIKSKQIKPNQIYASNPSMGNLEKAKKLHNIHITQDNRLVAEICDVVFLSVQPHLYAAIIGEIKDVVKSDAIIILVAAGQTLDQNIKRFGRDIKMVKAMPNTPSLIGEGMTSLSINPFVTEKEKEEIKALLESFGRVELIEENLMDAASAVGGSSPAFVYLFIEALADSAVMHGMSRKQAYVFAAQSVLGAAKMVLETDTHPGELKDMVCSPGGSTIEGIASLEENGLRAAVIKAVNRCVEKTKSISKL